jgi:hypothetical protein
LISKKILKTEFFSRNRSSTGNLMGQRQIGVRQRLLSRLRFEELSKAFWPPMRLRPADRFTFGGGKMTAGNGREGGNHHENLRRQPKRPRKCSGHSAQRRSAIACAAAAAASAFLAPSFARAATATYTWTNGDTTGSWSSTSLSADWKSSTFPNAAGTTVLMTSTNGTFNSATLDTNATVGQLTQVTNGGGEHWSILYNGSTYYTLTMWHIAWDEFRR